MNSILNVKEKTVLEFTDTIKIEDLLRASQCFPRIYWSLVWRYLLIYSFIPLIFGAYFRSLLIFIIVLFIIGLYVLVKIKLEYNKILTKDISLGLERMSWETKRKFLVPGMNNCIRSCEKQGEYL